MGGLKHDGKGEVFCQTTRKGKRFNQRLSLAYDKEADKDRDQQGATIERKVLREKIEVGVRPAFEPVGGFLHKIALREVIGLEEK